MNDDELRASVGGRSDDCMFGEEIMGVQRHASLLPIGMYFDCGEGDRTRVRTVDQPTLWPFPT